MDSNRLHADPYKLAVAYLTAKSCVLEAGFASEIDLQEERSLACINERDFLCEGAWVILSSGMRESVVRVKFPQISAAFGNWQSAAWIVRRTALCKRRAIAAFAHAGKINAIAELARRVHGAGIDKVLHQVSCQGIAYLRTFPFMGPATAFHFAKNLGLDVVKPDRHLMRASKAAGFDTAWELCNAIAKVIGEKPSVVDLVIWRYATIYENYVETFAACLVDAISFNPLSVDRDLSRQD